MRATISQAENNKHNLSISRSGYGHWRISMNYRGKTISTVTTNSVAIDDFNAEFGEKRDGCNRRKAGYESLCNEIIRKNNK